jgi:hypothetical protein
MSRDIANHFRMLALEAMAAASEMTDPECRLTMEQIATAYETLADRFESIECPHSQRRAEWRRGTQSRGSAMGNQPIEQPTLDGPRSGQPPSGTCGRLERCRVLGPCTKE